MRRRPGLAYDMRRGLLLAGLLACAPAIVTAQSVESDVTPESEALVKSDGDFVMSSIVPDKTLEAAQYEDEHDRFSVKFGFVVMPMDYTSFDQDCRQQGSRSATSKTNSRRARCVSRRVGTSSCSAPGTTC